MFKTKALEHEPPADYKKKTKGSENMDETKVQEMIDKSNAKLLDELKGIMKPTEPAEPAPVAKELDEDAMVDRVTKGVVKAMGIEVEEDPTPEDGKIIIMDSKALEELQADTIQKTILGIASQRQGEKRAKSVATGKFDLLEETPAEPDKKKGHGVSTRKAAEMHAERKGLKQA